MKKLLIFAALIVAFTFTAQAKERNFDISFWTGCVQGPAQITGRVTDIVTGAPLAAKIKMYASDNYTLCQALTVYGTDNGYYTFPINMLMASYYVFDVVGSRNHYDIVDQYEYVYNLGYPYVYTLNFQLQPTP